MTPEELKDLKILLAKLEFDVKDDIERIVTEVVERAIREIRQPKPYFEVGYRA